MDRRRIRDDFLNTVNVWILLVIALLYVVTGTGPGDDALTALSDQTVYRGGKQDAVALECIVSWDAAAVEDMLSTLSESNARITFFVSGRWARENAKVLLDMVAAGHEIGCCGYTPTLDGDEQLMLHDVQAASDVIASITGERPVYYNGGLRNADVAEDVAKKLELTNVACSADLLSARGNAADIAIRASKSAFDGSILMIQPTAEAAAALPAILTEIERGGRRVIPVGELLK